MKQIKTIYTVLLILFSFQLSAQVLDPVDWEFSVNKTEDNTAEIILKAIVQDKWHIYGQGENGGYTPTTFTFNESSDYKLVGKVADPDKFKRKYDSLLEVTVNLYSHEVIFKQKIEILSSNDFTLSGNVQYFSCDDEKCLPPEDEEFTLNVPGASKKTAQKKEEKIDEKPVAKNIETEKTEISTEAKELGFKADIDTGKPEEKEVKSEVAEVSAQADKEPKKSLWGIFIISVIAGLGGLLTPCVYPMIPMTVSFFMQGKKSRGKAITEAFVFGISIVAIYTLIGVIVAIFKNANMVSSVTSHWLLNSIFFVVFLVLAGSFFGLFEIVLPSGFANKVDAKADKGGYIGAFFMALGMTILSFSCTGPIVASLLIKAAEGEVIEPIIGMFGFGLIFATPFTLFAIFPSWLQGLPKSGGWLNSVKVFFAFVMLAFSLYFLSKIDQVYHLDFLPRDIYLMLWIIIFGLLGLYLLGKIKFAHDSEFKNMTVSRLVFVIAIFFFVFYLFSGLFGNELKSISPLLPPTDPEKALFTNHQQGSTVSVLENTSKELCDANPKYSDFLHLPHNLKGYFDYQEGMACAKELNKPVFLDFKGHVCSNCKEMEAKVWSDPRVLERLKNDFVIIGIFTDDPTKLPENEWYTSERDGKVKKTIGKKNVDFQISKFNTNSIPYYAIVDLNGDVLVEPRGHNLDVEAFIDFLDKGKEAFGKSF